MVTREEIIEALREVIDPELGKNIVELGMVENVEVSGDRILCEVLLTAPMCPAREKMKADIRHAIGRRFGSNFEVEVVLKSGVKRTRRVCGYGSVTSGFIDLSEVEDVRNIVAVYSCKGGVGKSTVAVNLAFSLAKKYGAKVGVLDLDLHGPDIPIMLGIVGRPKIRDSKILPPEIYGVKVMSVGLLVDSVSPIAWRGPIQNTAIKQLFEEVRWGELDYLILDLPPGTGDIQITLSQNIPISGVLMVSTPQFVAMVDTVKGANMFTNMGIPVIGMVINMAYYLCPHCKEKNYVFPKSTIDEKSLFQGNVDILGEIPLDPKISEFSDKGIVIVIEDEGHYVSRIYMDIAGKVASVLSSISPKNRFNDKG